jgi:small subunit ribosomal protein S1
MENLLTKSDDIVVYKAGQTIKGVVIDTNSSRILLDLEGGLTGIITKKEATGYGVSTDTVEKGSTVEALVINPETEQGLVALSLRRASQENVWAELSLSKDEERIIKVKITEANKGGLIATYKGIRAFLPVSQLTPLNYPRVDGAESGEILRKLGEHIGKDFAVRVINVDRESGKLIVSEKAAHEESKKETLKNLRAGDIVKGTVSGVVKFGIFVAFGGVEGLVHLSELDWGHVSNPAKIYSLNDKVEVVILSVDGDKLALSIKRLSDDPWKEKVEEYSEGQEVSGKVVRWNSAGVFIEIKPEVMGTFSLDQFGVESHNDLEITSGEVMTGTIEQVNLDSHRLDLKKV